MLYLKSYLTSPNFKDLFVEYTDDDGSILEVLYTGDLSDVKITSDNLHKKKMSFLNLELLLVLLSELKLLKKETHIYVTYQQP